MKTIVDDINKINQFKEDLKGVFTLSDLKVLLPSAKTKTSKWSFPN